MILQKKKKHKKTFRIVYMETTIESDCKEYSL